MSLYEIGVCQRFSSEVHGFDLITSSPGVENHYLCLFVLSSVSECHHVTFIVEETKNTRTPCSIEIVETDVLYPGGETVAIYKTFWLRILQKKIRRWLKIARTIRTNRIYHMIMRREYTGSMRLLQ